MKKNILIILGVIFGITLILGTTYAIYTWSYKTIFEGKGNCFDVVYAKGRDIGSNENSSTLMAGSDFNSGLSTTVVVKLNNNCKITSGIGTLYLETDGTTGSGLLTSGALKYQVIDGNTFATSGVISSSGKVAIYENFEVTDIDKSLIVIVWLDGEEITLDNQEGILSSIYKGSVSLDVESR